MSATPSPSTSGASRRREFLGGRLIQNAAALMASAAGTAVLGVVFWGVAAHVASEASLGRSSAEIAAMVLIANLSQLSFGSIFERFLPVSGGQTRRFVTQAYAMCLACAFAGALIYILLGLDDAVLPPGLAWHVVFIVSVMTWTLFILQDSVLVGLRASRWVPVENILFGVAKLALLPLAVAWSSREGVFLAWTTPVIFTIVAVTWYLFKRRIPAHMALKTAVERAPTRRELFLLAGAQYATLISSVLTPQVVTLIVIRRLGAVPAAHYYIPSLIASSFSLANVSIARSFLVEAASEPHQLRRHANTSLRAMAALVVPGVVVGVIFAPQILTVFGASYAAHGTTLLRLLLLALPLGAITTFYSSFAWLDRRVWWMTIGYGAGALVYFSMVLLLIGHLGIVGIGVSSLVTSAALAVVYLPITVRRYRRTTNDPSLDPAA